MTNAIYPKWKEASAQGVASASLAGAGATGLYAALVDTGTYAYNAAHQFYSDLGASVIGTPVELTNKTFLNGLLDADDSTFTAVSGPNAEALALFVKNAGANTTWRLFAYFDQGVSGLPVQPNGGDIGITWNVSGIVQL